MKKVILSAVFAMIAVFAMAQSNTKNVTALEILKMTPEAYAEKVQSELQQVCHLKADQIEKVFEIAKKTAENIHELEEVNNGVGNPDHEKHVALTLKYGDAYIIRLLDKNQRAAYDKKDRILRKEQLIKERQEMAKKYSKDKN